MVLYYGGLKKTAYALIAQLDRASGYGPEGREFESSSARQNSSIAFAVLLFFLYIKEDSNSERVSCVNKTILWIVFCNEV